MTKTTDNHAVRTGIAMALTLVIVLAAAAIAFLLDRRADAEQALDARHDVVRVAEQFTARVNNYDSASVEDYKASVSEMLSTKFRGEFDKAMADIITSVKEAEMSSEGSVLASGVASLDQDSAEVLVVADAEVDTVFEKRQRHFRWEIALVKVDGTWLVDDFTPVA